MIPREVTLPCVEIVGVDWARLPGGVVAPSGGGGGGTVPCEPGGVLPCIMLVVCAMWNDSLDLHFMRSRSIDLVVSENTGSDCIVRFAHVFNSLIRLHSIPSKLN